jgi:hypothetical protein
MNSKLFWLGSALCGALLVNGCSSSTTTDGGTSTAGTSGSSGTTSASTTGSTSAGTTGNTISSSTGTTTGTTTAGTSAGTTTGTTTGGSATTTGGGTTTGGSATTTGTTTGGNVIGMSCNPTASPDTVCAPTGYWCDPTSSTCQLPSEFVACNDSVGCATGLTCTAGVPGASGSICLQVCTDTASCLDPLTACTTVGSTSTMGCLLNNNCTGAYTACNSAGTADGTCYPAASNATLYCQQGGPVAANQPCSSTRANADADLCVIDAICITFGTTSSACLNLCTLGAPAGADGGPGCPSTALCVGLSQGTNWGVCLLGCNTVGDCPSPYTQCVGLQGLNGTFCVP